MGQMYKAQAKAIFMELEKNNNFLSAILVYLGALSVLLAFPAFSPYVVPLIALIPALIAYYHTPIGTIVSVFLANLAIAFQTPVMGWMSLIALSITMFAAFTHWYIISVLGILMFAPFVKIIPLGIVVIPVMFFSAFKLGAKRSLMVTLPAVYVVLLLSAIWGVDNGAFMYINQDTYSEIREMVPSEIIMPMKDYLPIISTFQVFPKSLASFFDWGVLHYMSSIISMGIKTTLTLFFSDIGLLQIISFGGIIYFSSLLPGIIRHDYEQTLASLIYWILIPLTYFFSQITGNPFNPLIIVGVLFTTLVTYYLDKKKFYIAGQTSATLRERESKFAKAGVPVQDLGLASKTKLSDIGGYEDVKKELSNAILLPLQRKELSAAYNIKPPKGLLLFGPPGTGKTMLMTALAKEMEVGFYYVKASDLLNQYIGESEKNVAKIFDTARKNSPSVLFFDEIDALAAVRSTSSHEAGRKLLNTILVEMDGLQSESNVLVVGATNAPHILDKAILRPGRLDKIIYMHLPDEKARKKIFKVHTREVPLDKNINFDKLAKITERFSGADIKNICQEATRLAFNEANISNEIEPVKMEHFNKVIKSLRPSTTLSMLDEYERFKLDFERRVKTEEEDVKKDEEGKLVKWKDVIGHKEVKVILKESIEMPLLHEDLFKQYDVKPSKGLLMFGPPGCGKTLMAKAVANEMEVNMIVLSGADMLKKGYEGAITIIKENFNRARENTPAIIFIDEIESIAPSRDLYNSKYVEDVVTQFLQEMDGMKELKGVFLIGATNKPDMIDKALMRPGRLDKIVFIPPPLPEQRAEMFKTFLGKVPVAKLDYEELAEGSEGFTGADIKSVCQEAKMELVRRATKGEKDAEITQRMLLKILSERKPSITVKMLQDYKKFQDTYGERK